MVKLAHIVLCVMAVWTAVLLFWTSQSVQKTERELKKLKQASYSEFEMVRVLSSEWDYLNRPERLERLALEYLSVDRVRPDKSNFMTSADLIEDSSVVQAVVKEKTEQSATLVSSEVKKAEPSLGKTEDKNIIRKPEQAKFRNILNDLTGGER